MGTLINEIDKFAERKRGRKVENSIEEALVAGTDGYRQSVVENELPIDNE